MAWNLVKGAIQMGIAPAGEAPFDVVPVDYAAAALVHLSLGEENLNRLFHLTHSEGPLWRDVYDFLRDYGYPLRTMEDEAWIEHTVELLKEDVAGENALSPFAPMVAIAKSYAETARREQRTGKLKPLIFDDQNTREGLRGSGIACPPLDARIFTLYVEYFIRSGFLPPPSSLAAPAGREVEAGWPTVAS
jgi:thioester reductase-like protein